MVCRARGLDYVLHMLSRPINSLGRRGTHINSLTSGKPDGGVVWSTDGAPLAHPVSCLLYAFASLINSLPSGKLLGGSLLRSMSARL